MADPRLSKDAALLLESLEACLIWMDEDLLLATALCAGAAGGAEPVAPPRPPRRASAKPRLGFKVAEAAGPASAAPPVPGRAALPSTRRRLRFAPTAPEMDRVVIQNWNSSKGYVPVGDVELELDPGQAVTLWVNRASATPVGESEEPPAVQDSLLILADEEALIA